MRTAAMRGAGYWLVVARWLDFPPHEQRTKLGELSANWNWNLEPVISSPRRRRNRKLLTSDVFAMILRSDWPVQPVILPTESIRLPKYRCTSMSDPLSRSLAQWPAAVWAGSCRSVGDAPDALTNHRVFAQGAWAGPATLTEVVPV
jgi:hypothetical protein